MENRKGDEGARFFARPDANLKDVNETGSGVAWLICLWVRSGDIDPAWVAAALNAHDEREKEGV